MMCNRVHDNTYIGKLTRNSIHVLYSYTKEGVEPPLRWSTSQCVEANVPLADHVRCVAALPKFVRESNLIHRQTVTLYGHNGAML